MKIVRFVTEGGKICLGSFDPARPGEARIIAGDLHQGEQQCDRTGRNDPVAARWPGPGRL